jgi:hypothetical protein
MKIKIRARKKQPKEIMPVSDDKKPITKEMIKEHPELYIQADIIDTVTGIIDTKYIFAKDRTFEYPDDDKEKMEYNIKPYGLNLLPLADNFIPVYTFIKGKPNPYDFKDKNKHVPSRIVTLLYDADTYKMFIVPEHKNLNLVLVIIGIATIIILAVYAWLNYGGGEIPFIGK